MKSTLPLLLFFLFSLLACKTTPPNTEATSNKLSIRAELKKMNQEHLATFSEEELTKLELLDTLSPLQVTTIKGKELALGKNSQQPTVLLLFATWCPACKVALPEIEALSKQYEGQANFLAIGREHSQEELETWLETQDFTIDMAADPERAIYSQFAGWAVPRLYVVDTTGKVAFQTYGWADYNVDMVKLALASF